MIDNSLLDISSIANIIQIAVAPVFLLAGISGLLAVMTNRLGRIIDRSRILQRGIKELTDESSQQQIKGEMDRLLKRGQSINYAITFATMSALMICLVIMTLFIGGIIDFNVANIIATLFIICMALLIVALTLFLREVYLGTRSMRHGLIRSEGLILNSRSDDC